MTTKVITTHDLYEGLQALTNTGSAYAVANLLGASRASGLNWRDGKTMDDRNAIKAAMLLNMDPDFVLACLAAERAGKSDSADAWRRIAVRLSTAASVVFLLVFLVANVKSPVL